MSKCYIINECGGSYDDYCHRPIKVYLDPIKANSELAMMNLELVETKRKSRILVDILNKWDYCDNCKEECRDCFMNLAYDSETWMVEGMHDYYLEEVELIK